MPMPAKYLVGVRLSTMLLRCIVYIEHNDLQSILSFKLSKGRSYEGDCTNCEMKVQIVVVHYLRNSIIAGPTVRITEDIR